MDYDKDFESGFEQTSLGAIHYLRHKGYGNKMIFLHGFGASTLTWKRLVAFLDEGLDITLIDLLGHGESDAPKIDYTISAQFQALREVISLQNNGDSFLFGNSYGGWVAAYYASQPYTCKGIILESPAGLKENFDDIVASGKEQQFKEDSLRSAMQYENNEWVLKSIINADFEEDQLTTETLSKIKKPTLILWGSEDTTIDKKYAAMFNSKIKGSELEIMQGVGHVPHYTNPEETAAIIRRFIASVS